MSTHSLAKFDLCEPFRTGSIQDVVGLPEQGSIHPPLGAVKSHLAMKMKPITVSPHSMTFLELMTISIEFFCSTGRP